MLGFITYNGNTYGFSSPESMAAFAANPSNAREYLTTTLAAAARG